MTEDEIFEIMQELNKKILYFRGVMSYRKHIYNENLDELIKEYDKLFDINVQTEGKIGE